MFFMFFLRIAKLFFSAFGDGDDDVQGSDVCGGWWGWFHGEVGAGKSLRWSIKGRKTKRRRKQGGKNRKINNGNAFVFVSVYIKSSSLHLFLHSNSKFSSGKKIAENKMKMKIFFLMHSTHRSSVPCLFGFSMHEAIFPFKYNFFTFNSFSCHPSRRHSLLTLSEPAKMNRMYICELVLLE